jgi:hypothetical protein
MHSIAADPSHGAFGLPEKSYRDNIGLLDVCPNCTRLVQVLALG